MMHLKANHAIEHAAFAVNIYIVSILEPLVYFLNVA